MDRRITARLLAAVVPGGPGAALLVLAPPDRLAAAWRTGLHAHDGGSALLLATTAAVAWAVVAWLTLGLVLAVVGSAPGAAGATARRIARRLTPAVLRSLLSGGTAVGLALTPALLPVAAHASPGCAPPVSAAVLPSLDRPAVACPAAVVAPPTSAPPTSAPPTSAPPTAAPPATPRPGFTRTPPAATAPAAPHASRTVAAGDTLWSLAGAELRAAGFPATDASIAQRWPAWWRANRIEIGADPALLHPGEVLQAPAALAHRETP